MTQELDDKAPLLDHLIELRRRIANSVLAVLAGFIVCYSFAEEVFAFLVAPLRQVLGPDAKMIYTGLHEAFFTYMKVSFYAGLFLAVPVILSQLWLFVAPGLYKHEKKFFMPFLFITPILFFAGGALAYEFVFPLAFKFFLSFASPEIEALPSLKEYLSLVMTLIFSFGLVFELPVGILLLIKAGAVSTASLVAKRKYFIVFAFIAGGILTPPDPFSQIMLAVPILLLYEVSIILGRYLEKSRVLDETRAEEA
ncbi:MAG: twin-arginine translocase subunit TatC [Magnetococcales bacterium]|nr:twin-arginine translocase subunit TatC [Magnetococcales bacterium]MBF0149227.1 twin-arginine translocase subunit TatC [Magnetococcales bacterium]MBF0171993.1 twin-arginine translocase subunit TatC [Magnetococcales bacterium]MBF0630575.1 twin-arginine translocase subunit TatC [Magnetococcales bacterium]